MSQTFRNARRALLALALVAATGTFVVPAAAEQFVPIMIIAPMPAVPVFVTKADEKVPFVADAQITKNRGAADGSHFWKWGTGYWPWARITIHPKGIAASIVREPKPPAEIGNGQSWMLREEVSAHDLLALLGNASGGTHVFEWKVEVGAQKTKDTFPEWLSVATSEFTLGGPANLAVSTEVDVGTGWPKKVGVRNGGGTRSQPSALEVDLQLVDGANANVKAKCTPVNHHQVYTVAALDPNAKKDFDVPGRPLPANHPSTGTHKMFACNYHFDAKLSGNTNELDPNPKNNHVDRTITVEVPLD